MTVPLFQVVDVPVSELRLNDRNPRRITAARFEQLKRSLAADPDMLKARPLIALPDGTVVAGNQRLRAVVDLGWSTVPCVFADLDDERATQWLLRDNENYGDWDDDAVAELLRELEQTGSDLDLAGFAADELERLLHPDTAVDDVLPVVPAEPRSVPGEVYTLGQHRLLCGDARDAGAVRALVGSCAPELLWTDPPYGVGYVGKTRDALRIEGDRPAGLSGLLADVFTATDAVLAPGSRFYIAAPSAPQRYCEFVHAIENVGWKIHQPLVWIKDSFVLGHADHHFRHEEIVYGWKPGPGRVGRGDHTGTRWYGDHAQDTVFEIPRPKRSTEHPTMKPVALVAAHLKNSTKRGDAVLDVFAGSGTTLVACEQLGRRCLAVELDPGYCDVTRQRYAALVNDPSFNP